MQILVPSDIEYIKTASSKILKSLEQYNLNEDRLFDIRLCVEEAIRNAIVHGNNLDRNKTVKVDSSVKNGRLYIEVEDEGGGFDPDNVADPTENSNIMKGSGRGIFLIRKLMNQVSFNKKGNKIIMEKDILFHKIGDKMYGG